MFAITWNLQVWASIGNLAKFIGHINFIRVAKTKRASCTLFIHSPWKRNKEYHKKWYISALKFVIILNKMLQENWFRWNSLTWSRPNTERLWNPFNLRISVSGSHILSTKASSTGIHSSVSDDADVWFTIFSWVYLNKIKYIHTLQ